MSLDGSSRKPRRMIRVAVAVAAMLIGGSAASAAAVSLSGGPAAGRVLGGMTSQHWPVVFTVAKDGKRIQAASIGLVLTCSSGDVFPVPDGWVRLPISANGRVNVTTRIPPIAGDSITGGSDRLTGRLNRRQATFAGTWQLHLSYLFSNGQTDQCDSGRVAFSTRL